ncbi:MAG: general secretion pathway protein H [Bacteroidia bacterium]
MNSRVVAPFAATHFSRVARARGFSLLELLVALIVIVLITSLVTLGVGSGGEGVRVDSQVRNLADVASYALDEAQMTGQDYGLMLREESYDGERQFSYSWQRRNLEGWVDTPEIQEIFTAQRFPPGIELELQLEDAPLAELNLDVDEDEDDKRPPSPQVVFYASGETMVGAIDIRDTASGDLLWRIEWDLLGRVQLMPRGISMEEE